MFPEDECEEELRLRFADEHPEVDNYEIVRHEGPNAITNPENGLGPDQVRYYAVFRDMWGEEHTFSVNYDPVSGRFGIIKRSSGKDE